MKFDSVINILFVLYYTIEKEYNFLFSNWNLRSDLKWIGKKYSKN